MSIEQQDVSDFAMTSVDSSAKPDASIAGQCGCHPTLQRAAELLLEYADLEVSSAAHDLPRRQQRAQEYAGEIRAVADQVRAIAAASQGVANDAADAAKCRALNTPEIDDFLSSVRNEALHQRERWSATGDAGKTDADWFWLIGYLAGKAMHVATTPEKRLHHIITTAAACLNWHGARVGAYVDDRPNGG